MDDLHKRHIDSTNATLRESVSLEKDTCMSLLIDSLNKKLYSVKDNILCKAKMNI